MPLPQTKNIELINQINHALEAGTINPGDFNILKQEALRLRNANIGEGDMLLGIIASLKGDFKEVRKRFRNAMAYDGQNDVLMFNYGHCLYRLGHYAEAIQTLGNLAESDTEAARIVACCCIRLGLTAKAVQYCELAGCSENELKKEIPMRRLISSKIKQRAFDAIVESFSREPMIWKSLSTR